MLLCNLLCTEGCVPSRLLVWRLFSSKSVCASCLLACLLQACCSSTSVHTVCSLCPGRRNLIYLIPSFRLPSSIPNCPRPSQCQLSFLPSPSLLLLPSSLCYPSNLELQIRHPKLESFPSCVFPPKVRRNHILSPSPNLVYFPSNVAHCVTPLSPPADPGKLTSLLIRSSGAIFFLLTLWPSWPTTP